jgi:predicted GTPase
VAKATGVWDVDELERTIPAALVIEWNEYLNWELEQLAKAIMGVLPAAGSMAQGRAARLTKPEDIGNFFDALGATTING